MRGSYRCRRIQAPPRCLRFRPTDPHRGRKGEVMLAVDELEAVRLADLEGLEHLEANLE